MELNVHYTSFVVQYKFEKLGSRTTHLVLGPPAHVSQAEAMIHCLMGLSFEERCDLNFMVVTQELSVEHPYPCEFLGTNNYAEYDFVPAPAALDQELCPGCGYPFYAGTNPMCTHPEGCGARRKMPDGTPYEEFERDENDDIIED